MPKCGRCGYARALPTHCGNCGCENPMLKRRIALGVIAAVILFVVPVFLYYVSDRVQIWNMAEEKAAIVGSPQVEGGEFAALDMEVSNEEKKDVAKEGALSLGSPVRVTPEKGTFTGKTSELVLPGVEPTFVGYESNEMKAQVGGAPIQ